ncbi:hypothetical protein ACQ4PT_059171 [Festuca glaucescens]
MGSKQQLRPLPISNERGGVGFDGKVASVRERSGLANASFRVYYSLRAGAVPFLWESAPGTPKRGAAAATANAVAPVSGAALLPPISPPPSHQSLQLKGRKGFRPTRSLWPAGGIVRALLGMLGLGAKKSQRLSRRRHASYR